MALDQTAVWTETSTDCLYSYRAGSSNTDDVLDYMKDEKEGCDDVSEVHRL